MINSTLRPFRPSDAAGLTAIMYEAVHTIGAPDYTPEQCKSWSPAPCVPAEYIKRVADKGTVIVAVAANNTLIAIIELEADGQIDCQGFPAARCDHSQLPPMAC